MGISFMKQWESSGLKGTIRLYTLYTIDNATLPAIGAAAVGSVQTSHWNPNDTNPRNQAFVREYTAKFNQLPSIYAVQGYDPARAIAAAMKTLNGKIDDTAAIARAIRKNGLESVRGALKYNFNGFLIQPYWKLEVVAADGKVMERGLDKVLERPDSFAERCPVANRL